MPRSQRFWVYLIIGLLWLSGCVWLGLDQLFSTRGPFGKTPHPWEQPIVLAHGILAIVSMYLLGWISAQHITHWWSKRLRRVSGILLCAFLAVLIVSGCALFFISDDRWQAIAAVIHEISGLGLTPLAVQHWFVRQRQSSSSDATVTGRI
jgi:succinate dehydrogenase/fumarate reductase cytochrome b subunit